jgi:hypothetical protein
MSIAPAIRDNNGSNPCVPPHLLGRLLDKLRQRIKREQEARKRAWKCRKGSSGGALW